MHLLINNRKLSARHKRQRGMALLGTMLLLFSLMAVALLGVVANSTNGGSSQSGGNGTMVNTNNALQMSNKRTHSTSAFNMAESGVEYTLQWMHSLSAPPSYTNAFTPAFTWSSDATTTLRAAITPDPSNPSCTFAVVVYPDQGNIPTNSVTGSSDKAYLIESVGKCNGSTEIVQAYVHATSLSKYLVLVNNWTNGNYWVSGLSTFDGPVHENNFSDPIHYDSNGKPKADGMLENVVWFDSAGSKSMGWTDANGNAVPHPLFSYTGSDAYENSGPSVNWYKNNYQNTSSPSGSDWNYIAAGGQNTVSYNADPVPFPATSSDQQDAAMGLAPGSTPPTPAHGVTVVPGGGITVGGDVDQMTLSTDPADSTKQVVEVFQKDAVTGNEDYTKITIDGSGQTSEQTGTAPAGVLTSNNASSPVTMNPSSSWPAPVTTVNNGVVYVDGNVGAQGNPKSGGLSGTIADNTVSSDEVTHPAALTIATNTSKNLNIDGSITYNTARQKDASGNYLSEANDANFVEHAGTIGVVSNNILITEKRADGSTINDIETNGTFLANGLFDVDNYASRPPHNWENMGGYLSSTVGIFGQFDGGGTLVHGMNNQFNYDARMRDNPPPFFPTTGNMYDVSSWHRAQQTLDGAVSAS